MTDFYGLLKSLTLAPARAMTAQPPQPNLGGGMLQKLHHAIDPVQAFGGYGNLAAMALPPGASGARMPTMKAPKKLYRGIVEGYQDSGAPGLGTYHLGKGLYSSPSKSFAKKYANTGKVVELSPTEAWPSNPLVLRGTGGANSLFLDYVFKNTTFKNAREFNKAYPDPGDFVRERGFNGVVIGDEVVRYQSK